ncbi:MAG: heavy metal-binding domain-containing protein [Firmicutes bacterium]|nr:heavy metal-binding domain-containing protein [Bacillota bacterium]
MSYTPGTQTDLPEAARERLAKMRGTGAQEKLFTSDLSVNEFLLVREAGFAPLGLVMGSSVYHMGFQWQKNFQNQELQVLTQATYQARELAITRMEEEADALGADGIVGVRFELKRLQMEESLLEVLAVGTAIKHTSGDHYRTNDNRPFTSDLSGQDFWTLLRAGYMPVSLVMGNCVYHVASIGIRQAWGNMGKNIEIPQYTQGIYEARELAQSRMSAEAEAKQAEGIIGADISEHNHGWDPRIIEYFAVGTAIKKREAAGQITTPSLVLTVNQ